jgi:hypothetical protein
MSKHYACMQHLLLPVVVHGPGKYLTRGGETVTVEKIANVWGYNNRADGKYSNGVAESWSVRGGRVLPYSLSQNDIIGKA